MGRRTSVRKRKAAGDSRSVSRNSRAAAGKLARHRRWLPCDSALVEISWPLSMLVDNPYRPQSGLALRKLFFNMIGASD